MKFQHHKLLGEIKIYGLHINLQAEMHTVHGASTKRVKFEFQSSVLKLIFHFIHHIKGNNYK